MSVFLLNKNKKPLDPIHPGEARKLLDSKQAVVHKRTPFTIRLKTQVETKSKNYRIKLDPGSKETGVAIVSEDDEVVHLANLEHRTNIKMLLETRRNARRRRRSANLRYRKPRFDNRTRPEGWLPPSLQARVDNIISWVKRYQKLIPITEASMELVNFDTQKLRNPEISGVEYQQGSLMGYEVREYLLEKFGRRCFYCEAENIPLEIEHVIPRALGGSDSVRNLTLACNACNAEKGPRTAEQWLSAIKSKRTKRYKTIQRNIPELDQWLAKPLKDAAAVNATKNRLRAELNKIFDFVEVGSGARTKMQRIKHNLPKEHYFDALCVGRSAEGKKFTFKTEQVLLIRARGRGSRFRSRLNKFGFPRSYMPKTKYIHGFLSGDFVRASFPKGKHKGTHIGFVAARSSGYFDIKNNTGGVVASGNARFCEIIERFSGYIYSKTLAIPPLVFD